MNILVLHSELGVLHGGGEYFTRNLFAEFVRRGHHVSAAFGADPRGNYPLPLPVGINPIPLPGWWSPTLGQGILSKIGGHISSESFLSAHWNRVQAALSWRAFRWHKSRFQHRIERDFAHRWQEFDAVYVHGRPLLAKNVATFRPTILMLPGPLTPDLEPVLRSIHAVCAHDDGLACVRTFLGDHVMELPLGINSHLFTPDRTSVRTNLGWTTKDLVVGYVGRLTHLKGIDLLSSAFGEISHILPNIKLLIVGSGEMEGHLRTALSSAIERKIVHIEPALPQEDLAPWYRAMDLMVMPSRYETMSSAVLEAMSCGVPFLASDVGGNRTLGETEAGWMFKSGSASSMRQSLKAILADPSEMRVRGAIGPEIIRERHSWTASAERLEFILKSRLGLK